MFQIPKNVLIFVILAAVISADDEMQRQDMILAPAKYQVNIPVTYSTRHHGGYVTGYGASNAYGWYGQGVRAAVRPLPSPSYTSQRYVRSGYGVQHSAPIFRWDATQPRTKRGKMRHYGKGGNYGKGRHRGKGGHRGKGVQVIHVVHPGYAEPVEYGYSAPSSPYKQTPYTAYKPSKGNYENVKTPDIVVPVKQEIPVAPIVPAVAAEVVAVAPVVEPVVAVEPVVEPVVEAVVEPVVEEVVVPVVEEVVVPVVEEVVAPVVEAAITPVVAPVVTAKYTPAYKTLVTTAPVEVPEIVVPAPVIPELIVPTPVVEEVVVPVVEEVVVPVVEEVVVPVVEEVVVPAPVIPELIVPTPVVEEVAAPVVAEVVAAVPAVEEVVAGEVKSLHNVGNKAPGEAETATDTGGGNGNGGNESDEEGGSDEK